MTKQYENVFSHGSEDRIRSMMISLIPNYHRKEIDKQDVQSLLNSFNIGTEWLANNDAIAVVLAASPVERLFIKAQVDPTFEEPMLIGFKIHTSIVLGGSNWTIGDAALAIRDTVHLADSVCTSLALQAARDMGVSLITTEPLNQREADASGRPSTTAVGAIKSTNGKGQFTRRALASNINSSGASNPLAQSATQSLRSKWLDRGAISQEDFIDTFDYYDYDAETGRIRRGYGKVKNKYAQKEIGDLTSQITGEVLSGVNDAQREKWGLDPLNLKLDGTIEGFIEASKQASTEAALQYAAANTSPSLYLIGEMNVTMDFDTYLILLGKAYQLAITHSIINNAEII